MADPVTIALVTTAVATAATGAVAITQSAYQGRVAEMNAQIADENARRALDRSKIEQEQSDQEASQIIAEQIAQQAGTGTTLSGASHSLTRRSSRILARRDALNIIQAGEIEAFNYRTQKANFLAEKKASQLQQYATGFETVGRLASGYVSGQSLIGGSRSSMFKVGDVIGRGPTPIVRI